MYIIPLLLILLVATPILAQEPKVQRGIPYAEPTNERQVLDVYAPATGNKLPVVVWIHGGGWHSGGDEAMQKDLSSIRHIAKGMHIPPFLILHVADHPETRGQSQRLLQVLKEASIPATTYAAVGKNHTTLNDDLGLADDRPTQEMFAFLSAVLKR